MKSIDIYLLRHGEITHKNSLAGHTDFKVTDKGDRQMHESVADLAFSQCLSSPLSRCKDFAEQMTSQSSVELIVEPQIAEMNFGDWDGKSYEHLWQQPKPNVGDFWQNPLQCSPPNGETFEHFIQRVNEWWQKFIEQVDQNTLIVTHAGVIKVLLGLILGSTNDLTRVAQIATTVSVGYGHVVHLTCFKEQQHPAYVQVKL